MQNFQHNPMQPTDKASEARGKADTGSMAPAGTSGYAGTRESEECEGAVRMAPAEGNGTQHIKSEADPKGTSQASGFTNPMVVSGETNGERNEDGVSYGNTGLVCKMT